MITIDELPSEILSDLFLYLTSPKELLQLRLVNKIFETNATNRLLEDPHTLGSTNLSRNLLQTQFAKNTLFKPNWRHIASPRFYNAADRILVLVNVARSYQINTDYIITAFQQALLSQDMEEVINHIKIMAMFPALVIQSQAWPAIYKILHDVYVAPYHFERHALRYQTFVLLHQCATVAPIELRHSILKLLVDHVQESDNYDFYQLRSVDLTYLIDCLLAKLEEDLHDKFSVYIYLLKRCIELINDPAFPYPQLYEKCKASLFKMHGDTYFLRETCFFWRKMAAAERAQALQQCALDMLAATSDKHRHIYLDMLEMWFKEYRCGNMKEKIASNVIASILRLTEDKYGPEVRYRAQNVFLDSLHVQDEACFMSITLPMLMPKLEMNKGNHHYYKQKLLGIFKEIKQMHPDDWISRIYRYFNNRSCDWRYFHSSFRVAEHYLAAPRLFNQMLMEFVPDKAACKITMQPVEPFQRMPITRPDTAGIMKDLHNYLALPFYDNLMEYIHELNVQELRELVIQPSIVHQDSQYTHKRILLYRLWIKCYDLHPEVLPDVLPLLLDVLASPCRRSENGVVENFISYLLVNGKLLLDNQALQITLQNLPATSLIKITVNLLQCIEEREPDLRYVESPRPA